MKGAGRIREYRYLGDEQGIYAVRKLFSRELGRMGLLAYIGLYHISFRF